MKEIEIKILNICEAEIKEKLSTLGVTFAGEERQVNQIFGDGTNGLLVRLRTMGNVTTFTTKTPVESSEYKIREELESRIEDPETFINQLEMLGFQRSYYLEKNRATYIYKGTKICIDEYPDIPPLLEIEGEKEVIKEVVIALGYKMKDTCTMNCRDIIKMYRPGVKKIRFGCSKNL